MPSKLHASLAFKGIEILDHSDFLVQVHHQVVYCGHGISLPLNNSVDLPHVHTQPDSASFELRYYDWAYPRHRPLSWLNNILFRQAMDFFLQCSPKMQGWTSVWAQLLAHSRHSTVLLWIANFLHTLEQFRVRSNEYRRGCNNSGDSTNLSCDCLHLVRQ